MGIINVTPDSFSDGGRYPDVNSAVAAALRMEREGADIIDVGGESTRPGAEAVSSAVEMRRILPVIKKLSKRLKVPMSVDTRKADVATAALMLGAVMVNDVSGLNFDENMARVIAGAGATVIIMHMRGEPVNMQDSPCYSDVVREIKNDLLRSINKAISAGIRRKNIIIDPGICFGKTPAHNIDILKRLSEFKSLGYPVCVGLSRKSFIGKILNKPRPQDRLLGTLAANVIAMMNGADILRVHDVRENTEAARLVDAVTGARTGDAWMS